MLRWYSLPRTGRPSLVPGPDRAAGGIALTDPRQEGSAISDERLGVAPKPGVVEPSCVVASGISEELRSALFSESSTSRDANAQIRCAQSGLWGFTSTVRPAFGNLTSYLVCYGGCAKGRIKTEASHWIVDAITAAYTSQGLECPFHIRVYSTRVIASCAWLKGMSIREICFAAGWSSQNTLPGFTSWTVSPWPPKCCRWVTDSRLCYLYSYVFAASHSNYSVQPFYAIVVVVCPVLSAAPVIQCIFYWCTIMFCVDCC